MKLFGSIKELASVVFRKSTRQITVEPAAQTVGDATITIPDMAGASQDVVLTSQTQTLTNKTLTSPTINGGTLNNVTLDSVDALRLQDSASYDLILASSSSLTADQTLTLNMQDGSRTLSMAGNLTKAGSDTLTLTTTAASNVTFPTTGTLATLAGAEALTNKTQITVDNLDLNGSTISSTSGQNITIAPDTGGYIHLQGNSTGNVDVTAEAFTLFTATANAPRFEINNAANTYNAVISASNIAGSNKLWNFPNENGSEFVGTTVTQTLTNKTLTSPTLNTPTVGTSATFTSGADIILNDNDNSQAVTIAVPANLTNNRTWQIPDADNASPDFVGTNTTQTLTNKNLANSNNTLTGATATSFTGSGASTITLPTSTSTLATLSLSETLTNKTLQADLIDDYLDFNEEAAPGTPASGKVRVYAKSDGKIYRKDDLGTESELGGGGGSGEINVIDNPSESTNWVASGAGITVATTVTAGELPLAGVIDTGIKIDPVSGTDYVRYRWTMPASLKNKKLKVEWHQQPESGYASGDLKVEVYKNSASDYSGSYTEFALSTDSSGTSSIPNATGKYTTTFDADSGDYYELRIVRTAGTNFMVFSNVIVGPGIQPQGAVVGEWQSYTPTLTGVTTSTNTAYYRRVGSNIEAHGFVEVSASSASVFSISLPSGLTWDTSKLEGSLKNRVGYAHVSKAGAVGIGSTDTFMAITVDPTATSVVKWSEATATDATGNAFNSFRNGNDQVNATGQFHWSFSGPIAEWAGSGTVNLAQNDVEYASNYNTANTDDTTSFAYGPAGSTVPTSVTAYHFKRVRFQTPIRESDSLVLEVNSGTGWVPIVANDPNSGIQAFTFQNGSDYGMGIRSSSISGTDVDVYFGSYGYASGTYGAPGATWSSFSSWKWRVRKVSSGQAVGFGMADTSSAGLVSTQSQTFAGQKTFSGGFKTSTFSAYKASGTTTFSNAGHVQITFGTEEYDTNSNYDTSNSRFTPTIPGKYLITVSCFLNGTSGDTPAIKIARNGGVTGQSKFATERMSATGVNVTVTVTAILDLNGSTDYVEVYGINSTANTITVGNGQQDTYFQGTLVG